MSHINFTTWPDHGVPKVVYEISFHNKQMPFIYKAMNMSYLSIKENNTESFTILLCQKK